MQQIITHTAMDSIYLLSAEIFTNATVNVMNKKGDIISYQKMINTNFITLNGKFEQGEYQILVEENGRKWKRQIFI